MWHTPVGRALRVRAGVALACALALAGCGGARQPAAARPAPPATIAGLELLAEYSVPSLTKFDKLAESRFGGISGIAMDPRSGELLGISDDREHPRLFIFRLPPFDGRTPFRVDLHAYLPLPAHPQAPAGLDAEGIAMTRGGRVFVSSEGLQEVEPRVPPAIVEYTRNYAFVRQLEVPAKFVPPASGPLTRGVRNNAGFESLTLTPDERRLFTAAESPLAQDGPPATIDTGALVRVLEYVAEGDTYAPRREVAYPVDPLGPIAFTPGLVVIGLVELLAISDMDFLAMERGFAQEQDGPRTITRIRIYRMSIQGATDISGVDSIRGRRVVPARKTLLLDLATVPGLSPEAAPLDNFEGMAFGPDLPDGSRTLLIVSDDNFNPTQRTWFLLFRVI
jgi:hypothetical protein